MGSLAPDRSILDRLMIDYYYYSSTTTTRLVAIIVCRACSLFHEESHVLFRTKSTKTNASRATHKKAEQRNKVRHVATFGGDPPPPVGRSGHGRQAPIPAPGRLKYHWRNEDGYNHGGHQGEYPAGTLHHSRILRFVVNSGFLDLDTPEDTRKNLSHVAAITFSQFMNLTISPRTQPQFLSPIDVMA